MHNLIEVWPQNHISGDCFAVLSMDLTAPFLRDMGLQMNGLEQLRSYIKSSLLEDPRILRGYASVDQEHWLRKFVENSPIQVPEPTLAEFSRWVAETFTHVPADRPNWEGYDTFFFEWSVHMRDGEDRAGCFDQRRWVYESYHAFVRSRRLDQRIEESRTRTLTDWDAFVFSRCSYSLREEDLDNEEVADPFGIVLATADLNYFQEFWEYLVVRLSAQEKGRLMHSLRSYHAERPWQSHLVSPDELIRKVR